MLYVKQKCPVTYDEKRTGDPLAGSASTTILQMSSEVFRHLWESLDMLCHLKKTWHSQDKNLMPITQKKLAGI